MRRFIRGRENPGQWIL